MCYYSEAIKLMKIKDAERISSLCTGQAWPGRLVGPSAGPPAKPGAKETKNLAAVVNLSSSMKLRNLKCI